jgi:hypothetical protein
MPPQSWYHLTKWRVTTGSLADPWDWPNAVMLRRAMWYACNEAMERHNHRHAGGTQFAELPYAVENTPLYVEPGEVLEESRQRCRVICTPERPLTLCCLSTSVHGQVVSCAYCDWYAHGADLLWIPPGYAGVGAGGQKAREPGGCDEEPGAARQDAGPVDPGAEKEARRRVGREACAAAATGGINTCVEADPGADHAARSGAYRSDDDCGGGPREPQGVRYDHFRGSGPRHRASPTHRPPSAPLFGTVHGPLSDLPRPLTLSTCRCLIRLTRTCQRESWCVVTLCLGPLTCSSPPAFLTATSLQNELHDLIGDTATKLHEHLTCPQNTRHAGFAKSSLKLLRRRLEGASRADPSAACGNPPAILPSLQNS